MSKKPTTLLDIRVPQPARESDYGVPDYIVSAANVLYRSRNAATEQEVNVIDAAILRLYIPYTRES